MKYLFSIFIITLLVSCGCVKRLPPEIRTEVRTEIKEIIRDSIITVPADNASLKALLACDSVGNVYLKTIEEYKQGKQIKIPIPVIKYNTITVTATVDSAAVYLQWKEKHTTKDSIQVIVQPPVEINKPTGWQWFQIWAGRLAGLALIIVLVVKSNRLKL